MASSAIGRWAIDLTVCDRGPNMDTEWEHLSELTVGVYCVLQSGAESVPFRAAEREQPTLSHHARPHHQGGWQPNPGFLNSARAIVGTHTRMSTAQWNCM